jgi:putative flippase GtrA
MAAKARAGNGTGGQVRRFGLVGILNTLIDFVLFQLITKVFSIPLSEVWVAKLISGAAAMVNSFFFNRAFVFRSSSTRGNTGGQAAKFFISTVIGVFLIQTSLTQFFSSDFPAFGRLAYDIAATLGLTSLLPQVLTEAFTIKTVAFGIATVASLTWNFLAYKFWAFSEKR